MDETAITIVSVFVAGVIGPGITVLAASRSQTKRFAHERTLHDLDDVRRELDHLGDDLGHLMQALSWLTASIKHVEHTDEVRKHHADTVTHAMAASERTSRLAMRLGSNAEVAIAAQTVLSKTNELVDDLMAEKKLPEPDEMAHRQRAIAKANAAFFTAGNCLVGARI